MVNSFALLCCCTRREMTTVVHATLPLEHMQSLAKTSTNIVDIIKDDKGLMTLLGAMMKEEVVLAAQADVKSTAAQGAESDSDRKLRLQMEADVAKRTCLSAVAVLSKTGPLIEALTELVEMATTVKDTATKLHTLAIKEGTAA